MFNMITLQDENMEIILAKWLGLVKFMELNISEWNLNLTHLPYSEIAKFKFQRKFSYGRVFHLCDDRFLQLQNMFL